MFNNFSLGVATNRDAWVYQYSQQKLEANVHKLIEFYNAENNRIQPLLKANPNKDVGELINIDSTKISWTRA
ncbi:hypothetical protein GPS47_16710 [Acinetobacter haemolyticus]|uniref:type ISP restriction/modification enzyme n=2 Tax=Moraxellaceae TaxID=468 RepID=UPI001372881A|nr:type ISP restriction/modification enzyme [Acinetobacter haemolyticus]NAS07150.1 hypothetical protein [Acinetobacter haemolyticus]